MILRGAARDDTAIGMCIWPYGTATRITRIFTIGMCIEGRQGIFDTPACFVALEYAGGRIADIRYFLYARDAMEGGEIRMFDRIAATQPSLLSKEKLLARVL